jgi:hypothetical protein
LPNANVAVSGDDAAALLTITPLDPTVQVGMLAATLASTAVTVAATILNLYPIVGLLNEAMILKSTAVPCGMLATTSSTRSSPGVTSGCPALYCALVVRASDVDSTDCTHEASATVVVTDEGSVYGYVIPFEEADLYDPDATAATMLLALVCVCVTANWTVHVDPGDSVATFTLTDVSPAVLPDAAVNPAQVLVTDPTLSDTLVMSGVDCRLIRYAGPNGFADSVRVMVYVITVGLPTITPDSGVPEKARVPEGMTVSTNCVMAELMETAPALREH